MESTAVANSTLTSQRKISVAMSVRAVIIGLTIRVVLLLELSELPISIPIPRPAPAI